MAQRCVKMSLKLLLFIVFFGIALQSFGNKTKGVANLLGVNKASIFMNQSLSELSLTSDSLNLNSSSNNVKRYVQNNLKEIDRLFSAGIR